MVVMFAVSLAFAFAQAGAGGSPQSPGDVVARIHGKPVMRAEASTGSMLLGRVLGVLLDEFAGEQKIGVTKDEIDAEVEKLNRSMERTRAEWRARLAKLEATTPRTAKSDEEIALLRRVIESDTRARDWEAKQSPAMIRRSSEDVARTSLRGYKINQALYRVYGGRVIFQQAGPEPVDAYRRFLEERQKSGAFAIVDPSLRSGFWEYMTNDRIHTFLPEPEGRELMTTPWWTRE